MATLLTGFKRDELVFISTDQLNVTLKGPNIHPNSNVLVDSEQISQFEITCQDQFHLELASNCGLEAGRHHAKLRTCPIFYERQNYELIIENSGDCTVEFWHDNLNGRNKIGAVGRSGKILSGIINFGDEIGYSDLCIHLNGAPYLKLSIEVFPTKLHYQNDYQQILADITDELYNLAFEFVRKTYFKANSIPQIGSSPTEFFSMIRAIYGQFLTALDIIIAHPNHILQTRTELVPPHKIVRMDKRSRKWLQSHPNHIQMENGQINVDRALSLKKEITYNTAENQFVKFMLHAIVKKLKNVRSHYEQLHREKDFQILGDIDAMIAGISHRERTSFLNAVSNLEASAEISMVFSMAPGYQELYKYYLILQRGLALDGDIFKISVKDLSILYEYWCFIKLNQIMKKKYRLLQQDIIKTDGNGLFVTLQKGVASTVTYENPANGELIELSYNPKKTMLPTVAQKPDNVLTLRKKGASVPYQYVFDAKYRINPALNGSPYKALYGAPGPDEADINTMHRYRDALVYANCDGSVFERTMFGAYVLFPYGNEIEYQNHKFYQSIEAVNIGGLPFLPTATSLVSKLLDELIADSPESAFERTTLPVGVSEKLAQIDLSVRDVMVGVVRSPQQLEMSLKQKFYHIPAAKVADHRLPVHYIALYQPGNVFGDGAGIHVYGEVIQMAQVLRKQIPMVSHDSNPDEVYDQFFVREWLPLPQTIKPLEFGPRVNMYTNLYLLQTSAHVPELYIRSHEEFRLYSELKRLSCDVSITVDQNDIDSFVFNQSRICLENGQIEVHTPDSQCHCFDLNVFKNRPRALFTQIRALTMNGS